MVLVKAESSEERMPSAELILLPLAAFVVENLSVRSISTGSFRFCWIKSFVVMAGRIRCIILLGLRADCLLVSEYKL